MQHAVWMRVARLAMLLRMLACMLLVATPVRHLVVGPVRVSVLKPFVALTFLASVFLEALLRCGGALESWMRWSCRDQCRQSCMTLLGDAPHMSHNIIAMLPCLCGRRSICSRSTSRLVHLPHTAGTTHEPGTAVKTGSTGDDIVHGGLALIAPCKPSGPPVPVAGSSRATTVHQRHGKGKGMAVNGMLAGRCSLPGAEACPLLTSAWPSHPALQKHRSAAISRA